MKFILSILPHKFAICHLGKNAPIPAWALNEEFFSITKTDEEVSIVFLEDKIPGGVLFEGGWKAIKLEDITNGIYRVGVISDLTKPLAEANISVFNISTYQTNYILVEDKNLDKAIELLSDFCEFKE